MKNYNMAQNTYAIKFSASYLSGELSNQRIFSSIENRFNIKTISKTTKIQKFPFSKSIFTKIVENFKILFYA
jgi:hypothetical protein